MIIEQTTQFFIETCCNCGVSFGMTRAFEQERRRTKRDFYCPNGHSLFYDGESDKDRAQRLAGQLDQEKTRSANLRDENKRLGKSLDYQIRARKSVSTRLKKVKTRVAHGVCPCCNRTFQQLSRHMESKHPDFVEASTP